MRSGDAPYESYMKTCTQLSSSVTKAPKPEPKTLHTADPGCVLAKGKAAGLHRFEGGSTFLDNKFLGRNDIDESLLEIIQAKMDQSSGVDKGACAWCLLGPNGCPHDKRVGVQASCGRAHMGPTDRKPAFCIAAVKSSGLEGPLYLNNKKFWTASLTGHSPSEAKAKAKASGGPKGTPAPSDADDDDDDS